MPWISRLLFLPVLIYNPHLGRTSPLEAWALMPIPLPLTAFSMVHRFSPVYLITIVLFIVKKGPTHFNFSQGLTRGRRLSLANICETFHQEFEKRIRNNSTNDFGDQPLEPKGSEKYNNFEKKVY